MKKVLTIAGSDSCGGAGIQADLKTFGALGVYGMSVITAVTAQNTLRVLDVAEITPEMVGKQITAVFEDITVDALKIGMVSNAGIIYAIKEKLLAYQAKPIVLDPVMISKSGYHLLQPDAVQALRELIPIADLTTPNIPEAELLSGVAIDSEKTVEQAAFAIQSLGAKNVLIKGGHRSGNASDWLLTETQELITLPGERIHTVNTHGTGCTLSAAIAAYLAQGRSMRESVAAAKSYIAYAIAHSFAIGHGVGPVGHYAALYRQAGLEHPCGGSHLEGGLKT
jgi:hydroxymethylpyrimidine/phosphomethylpyrimidine kinase